MFFTFSTRIIKALLVLIFVISIMGVMSSCGFVMREVRLKAYSIARHADLNSVKTTPSTPPEKNSHNIQRELQKYMKLRLTMPTA